MKNFKKALQYIPVMALAALAAIMYNVFVFPNSFAPSGVDGICTMIQDISGISIGYLALLVNIPLLIGAYLVLNKEFAVKTTVYVITFACADIVLKHMGIDRFSYYTPSGTSIVLAPIAAGTIRGIIYALCIKNHASSGGVDIIAALVKKRKPYFNLMNTIFTFNIFVALCSYFVYGFKLEPVICSIIYSFTTSTVSNNIQTSKSETIKFEVITQNAEKLCKAISDKIGVGATIIPAQGGYSGKTEQMVICVIPKDMAPVFTKITEEIDDTVVFKSIVNNSLAKI